jgi:plastocyanin
VKNWLKINTNLKSRYIAIVFIVAVFSAVIAFALSSSLTKAHSKILSTKNCDSICVNLTKDGMSPDTLTIKEGETVQFNSADGNTHNLGVGTGEGESGGHEVHHEHIGDFESGDFKMDEAWRVTFKQTGTYSFHDHYNPKLNILIVVYQPKNL